MSERPPAQPPQAAQEPVEQVVHGHRRVDPYAWLRAANWREAMQDPQQLAEPIRAYLEAENEYAETVMAPTADLRERLFRELRGRIREDDATVPQRDGEHAYYERYRVGVDDRGPPA